MKRILLCTADESFARNLARLLRAMVYDVVVADGPGGLAHSGRNAFDAVVTDLRMPGADGFAILDAVRAKDPRTPVIVMCDSGLRSDAARAMRLGARDFLVKPVDLKTLEEALDRALGTAKPPTHATDPDPDLWRDRTAPWLVGRDPAMLAVLDLLAQVSDTRCTLLLIGESGTGKKSVARAVVAGSARAEKPFVVVNCAAIPAKLVGSELFGQATGARSGPHSSRVGRFVEADGGTILLDQIGETEPGVQAKLFRLLQDGLLPPLGGERGRRIDVRILAASDYKLEHDVASGRFRADLFWRLNLIPVELPALRERSSDIPRLAEYFVRRCNEDNRLQVTGIDPDAMSALQHYHWPGNVQELEYLIEYTVTHKRSGAIALPDLPSKLRAGPVQLPAPAAMPTGGTDLRARLKSVEDRMLADIVLRTGCNKKRAAELLGLHPANLIARLRRKRARKRPPQTSAKMSETSRSLALTKAVTPGGPSHRRKATPAQIAEDRIEAARTSNASELDLHGLGLSELPVSIRHLTQLHTLNVFHNQISALPVAIGELARLKFLYLSENQLTALPESIGRLSQLQFLSAAKNRLGTLPVAIGKLSQLYHLDLHGNRLTSLPRSLLRLTGLKKLLLQENPDLGLPPEILGPAQHLEANDRPANPSSILDYYFKTSVPGNPLLRLPRGFFAADAKEPKGKWDVEGLFQLAIDDRDYANKRARQALEELAERAVVPLMSCVKKYCEKSAKLPIESIAVALSRGGVAMVAPLIRLLQESNGDIAAIVALGKLGDPRAVPVLRALFETHNPLISTQVATALAAIGNQQAVAALMQALDDEYFIARADAIRALGMIGGQNVIPAITKACSDPHERVRNAAEKALREITGRLP